MAPLTWLVTGCSSGLGEQFVHAILARGDRIIASGRNASTKLAHLQSTSATILDLDVSKPPEELTAKMEEALEIYGGIDVLVNNAGYIVRSPRFSFTLVHRKRALYYGDVIRCITFYLGEFGPRRARVSLSSM